MSWLDNWAIKRAEKIAKKKAVEENIKSENEKRHKAYVIKAMEQINKGLNHIEMNMKRPDLNIGERVVLNKYGLSSKYAHNGWDGGIYSILNHVDESVKRKPIYLKITDIKPTHSYVNEKIEKFIEERYNEVEMMVIADTTFKFFQNHMNSKIRDFSFKENCGIYFDVYFEIENCPFQPKWGLHSDCFLRLDTPEAKETIDIWEEEGKINFEMALLKNSLNDLEKRKKFIDEKYRHIVYN